MNKSSSRKEFYKQKLIETKDLYLILLMISDNCKEKKDSYLLNFASNFLFLTILINLNDIIKKFNLGKKILNSKRIKEWRDFFVHPNKQFDYSNNDQSRNIFLRDKNVEEKIWSTYLKCCEETKTKFNNWNNKKKFSDKKANETYVEILDYIHLIYRMKI